MSENHENFVNQSEYSLPARSIEAVMGAAAVFAFLANKPQLGTIFALAAVSSELMFQAWKNEQ